MTKSTCANCCYWVHKNYNDDLEMHFGDCRRYAPRPESWQPPKHVSKYADLPAPQWPETNQHCWCGEWSKFLGRIID